MDGKTNNSPVGIEADLDMIFAQLGTLRDLASDEEKSDDVWRVYDFGIRWGALMSGRLLRLEHYHQAGELAEDQERRYKDVKRQLRDSMPEIERLGLTRPRVSLDDNSESPRKTA